MVLRKVFEQGKQAGKDISVVGFDDEKIADYMTPGLTTMKIKLVDIGKNAMELLFDKMDEKPVPGEIKVPCDLVERESVSRI